MTIATVDEKTRVEASAKIADAGFPHRADERRGGYDGVRRSVPMRSRM